LTIAIKWDVLCLNLVSDLNIDDKSLNNELFDFILEEKSTYGPYSALIDSSKRCLNLFSLNSIGSLMSDFKFSQNEGQFGSNEIFLLSFDSFIIVLNYLS